MARVSRGGAVADGAGDCGGGGDGSSLSSLSNLLVLPKLVVHVGTHVRADACSMSALVCERIDLFSRVTSSMGRR